MPIRVACPQCSKNLAVKDELAGKRIRCPNCQNVVTIPAASNGAAKPPAPSKPAAGPAKAPAPPAKTAPAKAAGPPAKAAGNIKPTPPTKPAAGPAKANVQRKAAAPPPPAPLEDEDDFADFMDEPAPKKVKGKPAPDEDDDFADFADEPAPKKGKGKPVMDEDSEDEEDSEDRPALKKGKKGKGGDKKKKKGSSMMLVLVAVAVLVVIGGVAGAYFLFFTSPNRPVTQLKQPTIPIDDEEEKPAPMPMPPDKAEEKPAPMPMPPGNAEEKPVPLPDPMPNPNPMPQAAASHLDLIPADTGLMVTLRVADLWSKLPPDLKGMTTQGPPSQLLAMMQQMTGLQLEDVDRATVVVPLVALSKPEGPKDQFLVLVTTNKPYDPQKIQAAVNMEPQVKLGNITDTTFAVGPENLVQRVTQPAAAIEMGPLGQGIKLAKEGHALVIAAFVPDSYRKMATEQPLPSPFDKLAPLGQVQSSTIVADLDKDLSLQIRLNYADGMKAEEANKALIGGLYLGNAMIGGVKTGLEKQAEADKSPMLQQKLLLVQMGANLLAKVKSQAAGPAVQVDIKIAEADLQQLIQLAPAAAQMFMPPAGQQPAGQQPVGQQPAGLQGAPPAAKEQPKEAPAVLPLGEPKEQPKEAPKAQPPAKTPVLPLGDPSNRSQSRLELPTVAPVVFQHYNRHGRSTVKV